MVSSVTCFWSENFHVNCWREKLFEDLNDLIMPCFYLLFCPNPVRRVIIHHIDETMTMAVSDRSHRNEIDQKQEVNNNHEINETPHCYEQTPLRGKLPAGTRMQPQESFSNRICISYSEPTGNNPATFIRHTTQ